MVVPADRARSIMNALGHSAPIQFVDSIDDKAVNAVRPYKKYVQRIDAALKQVKSIIGDCEKLTPGAIVTGRTESFLDRDKAKGLFNIDKLELMLDRLSTQFAFFRRNNEALANEVGLAFEERFVLELAVKVLGNPPKGAPKQDEASASLLANEGGMRADEGMMFSNVAGTCPASDVQRIARQVFRATRGNTYTIHETVDHQFWDPKTEKFVQKAVFSIYFQGGASSSMHDKVLKLCQGAGCSIFSWADSRADAERRLAATISQISEKDAAQKAYMDSMQTETKVLTKVEEEGGNSYIEEIRLFVEKERGIYATLNMFEGAGQTLRARCWYPSSMEDTIKTALVAESKGMPTQAFLVKEPCPKNQHPPTFIPRTEFSEAFQELIDTYGTPGYKEANPALFAMVTFPVLFGIMYGDVFHGGVLFLVGIYGCLNASSLKYGSEAAKALHYARYLLLLMGFFAVYAGMMYNDFLSLGLNLFPSRYVEGGIQGKSMIMEPDFHSTGYAGYEGHERGPYPFGLDPAWHGADNELLFVNSLKMKISVLMGVTQMLVGVFLRWSNAFHFGKMSDFLCECIPMTIFMVCFFGYMDWMIIYKWVTPTTTNPSLINSMISMALGQEDKAPLYDGQVYAQGWLMFLTMIAVPWMLIPKPVYLYFQTSSTGHKVDADTAGHENDDHHDDDHDFSEVVIHQVIETIEFVLGTVSHTASYLRLWALSLAHQQLSLVFFQKAMVPALASGNPLFIYFGFGALMVITAGVLLFMDVLECFLHTLRLHWVEFQSKFFKADGYAFAPFSHFHTLKEVPA